MILALNQAVGPRQKCMAATGFALALLAVAAWPRQAPAQAERPSPRGAVDPEKLKQRDLEYEAIQVERKKAAEAEAKLRDEIDAIAADR
ncbi:MAG: hypothetical protein WEC82_06225, partial [Xanthobacteraceae bacterium]